MAAPSFPMRPFKNSNFFVRWDRLMAELTFSSLSSCVSFFHSFCPQCFSQENEVTGFLMVPMVSYSSTLLWEKFRPFLSHNDHLKPCRATDVPVSHFTHNSLILIQTKTYLKVWLTKSYGGTKVTLYFHFKLKKMCNFWFFLSNLMISLILPFKKFEI